MGLKLITPPTTSPVSLDDAKRQVRVHTSDNTFNAELQAYIDAATNHLDGPNGILDRVLEPQVWELTLDAFTDSIEIPLRPVISVESIKYSDADGAEQTLNPDAYTVDLSSSTAWVVRNSAESYPQTVDGINAVRVRFTAGYALSGSESGVPAALKQAILLLVGHFFENKAAVSVGNPTEVPLAFNALVMPYRRLAIA
ncbi:head-tail connector protein [Novosphingobium sp. JCM 18896]|uniref:head-tail connector protein n=1 Tax=Novosphingobium sp. JCM 18896 TaxID=2989731 RepID=UPI0022234E2E|nr:head-tail connector protein [Novosphingobium sp. JCM 18896]MCW1431398.1 head-tail connector protein [Novosphingobium sp. JCM 18896]